MIKKSHHLWGIRAIYKEESADVSAYRIYNTWNYIKPCTDDIRALSGINRKLYSQLEIRDEEGRIAKTFYLDE